MSRRGDSSWNGSFARDTQRARLEWLRAKMFVGSPGGVTERNMAIAVSDEIARKRQELREMTREHDLLKVDVDVIGIPRRTGAQAEDAVHGDAERNGH